MYTFMKGLGMFGVLAMLTLWLAVAIGWILNIIAIVHAVSGPFTTMLAVRLLGVVVVPLGGVMGWVS